MNIKILSPGCASCENLELEVINALAELDVSASVENSRDVQHLLVRKIAAPPALIINDKIKVSGRVPLRAEIKEFIMEELE